jgi:hypothetical protein
VLNQDSMVDVEEFPSPRSSRVSWLWQHCEVEHCCAKEELFESFGQQSWSHLRWLIYVLTELMLANSMQESFQRE